MSANVYKVVELVGSSAESVEAAIQNAVGRANESLRQLRWFEVLETRGSIDENGVSEWQVTVRISFTVD